MSFICSISGVQPDEPCLSKTGYVFERRLIEKHLQDSQICPVTGETLTIDDLTPIKCDVLVKPKPVSATSIPGLLSMLQSEWDALALETYNLRSHVDDVRKQLSYSLYQHDAATRVIARLIKQRDKALEEVEALQQQLLQFRANYDVNSLETGLDEDALSRLQELAKVLLTERKKRDLSSYVDKKALKAYKCKGDYRLHSSTVPGVSCVSIDRSARSQDINDSYCYTGGADGSIVYFHLGSGKTMASMNGHLKSVNAIESHPLDTICVSGSDDKTIRIWKSYDDEFKCSYILKYHKTPVRSLSIHPSGEYLLSSSNDGVWAMADLNSGKVVKMCRNLPSVCNNVKYHPDGMIAAGSGNDGCIHIWDLRTMEIRDPLTHDSNTSPITCLDFSENGYHLASTTGSGNLLLWDLRKGNVFQSIACNAEPSVVTFDHSGQYIGVGSTKLEVYGLFDKTNVEDLCTLEGHSGRVTGAAFGVNSSFILTACTDKSLRLFK